jgi:hypothetical protein
MSGDVLDLYRGHTLPEWWSASPPPWAAERDWAWYIERAQRRGAVQEAAEYAAAAAVTVAPER